MNKTLRWIASLLLLCFAGASSAWAAVKVASVEGVTEYRLDNGLRVLLVPDPSASTFTVHITYFVGSRHEGYGEKGMAHLLEHMLFKGAQAPRRHQGGARTSAARASTAPPPTTAPTTSRR